MYENEKCYTLRVPGAMESDMEKLKSLTGANTLNKAILEVIKAYIYDFQSAKAERNKLRQERDKAQNEMEQLKDLIQQRKGIVKKINKIIN